jgi:hypothetical protein
MQQATLEADHPDTHETLNYNMRVIDAINTIGGDQFTDAIPRERLLLLQWYWWYWWHLPCSFSCSYPR